MVILRLKPWLKRFSHTVLLSLCFMHSSYASTTGGGLPFDTALEKLKDDITGPVLFSISCIMLVITFVMVSFGEWSDGFKKVLTSSMWLSVAFSATTFITMLFGTGAVV